MFSCLKDDCVEVVMKADGTASLSDSGRSCHHHSGKKRFFSQWRKETGAGVIKVASDAPVEILKSARKNGDRR